MPVTLVGEGEWSMANRSVIALRPQVAIRLATNVASLIAKVHA